MINYVLVQRDALGSVVKVFNIFQTLVSQDGLEGSLSEKPQADL